MSNQSNQQNGLWLRSCVMGHENAGWVEDVGKDVTEYKKGDPVILHPLISGTGGTCLDCRRGNDMHAAAGAFPGLSIKEGWYSELLKTSVRNLIKLPKGFPCANDKYQYFPFGSTVIPWGPSISVGMTPTSISSSSWVFLPSNLIKETISSDSAATYT